MPTKHQVQRDKATKRRLERLRALVPQELTAGEWAALDAMHRAQRDPFIHARIICGDCPVQAQCLEYALANEPDEGMWGGLDGKERRSLRKRLSRARSKAKRANETERSAGIAN